jgi:hypothetical protein
VGLVKMGWGADSDGGGACYCSRDDVARVGAPFSIVSNLGVGAALVEGTAYALGCSGQSFLPIRKVNSRMRVIREGRLKDGHSRDHLYCGEDGKVEGGIP